MDNEDLLDDYGIFLIKSKGEQDPLAFKKSGIQHDWDDEHGTDIDFSDSFRKDRKIQLMLGVKASTADNFQDNVHEFLTFLQAAGLRQLRYSWLDRVFMVYLNTGVSMKRFTNWNDSLMVGQFGINLLDPVPVNRQWINTFTTLQSQVTINMADEDEQLTVYWGDGTKSVVTESGSPVTSAYGSAGTYYIVVAGNIQRAVSIVVTNATEIT